MRKLGFSDRLMREDLRLGLRVRADDQGRCDALQTPAGRNAFELPRGVAAVAAGADQCRIRPAFDAAEHRVVAAIEEILHEPGDRGQVFGRCEQIAIRIEQVLRCGVGRGQQTYADIGCAFRLRRPLRGLRHLQGAAGAAVLDDQQSLHEVLSMRKSAGFGNPFDKGILRIMSRPFIMAGRRGASELGFMPARLHHLVDALESEIERGRLPGAVALIARHGKLVLCESLGAQDPQAGVPMALDSIFRIYSMTKPIVSAAAMMLIERGRLLLSDPVAKFVPEFKDLTVDAGPDSAARPATRVPTVQDLLRHTAGLTYGFTGDSPLQRRYRDTLGVARSLTNEAFAQRIAELPLVAEPGDGLGVQPRDRRARPRARGGVGPAARRTLARAHLRAAGDARDRVLGAGRAGAPDRGSVRAQSRRRRDDADARPARSAGVRVGRRRPDVDRARLRALSAVHAEPRLSRRRAAAQPAHGRLHDRRPPGRHRRACGQRSRPICCQPATASAWASRCARRPAWLRCRARSGSYYWGGIGGTTFFVDPKEDLFALMMIQAPNQRDYYRPLFRTLVYSALID